MAGLRIAPGVELPLDLVTQSIAILARKGAGKTYTGSVIVEEVIRAQLPVVILDPTGAWWGLRASADGAKPGLTVVIFGGQHADVALERGDGREIASVVIDHPGAYILDLSDLPSKAAEQGFAADFLETLYRSKRPDTGPLLLVVDEADVFAPQRPGGEQLRTLGALESIVRRGRIKGLGDLLITQRAAVLNKNVLTQTEVLVVMQTTGPQDRAAIREWIDGNDVEDQAADVVGSLASMHTGDAWIWSPSFLRMLRRVKIRERRTFDSSRTPSAGEVRITPREFAKVDLDALGKRIAATREKAKANDPAVLRARIAELERDLATRPDAEPVTVEVPVVSAEMMDEFRASEVRITEGLEAFVAEVREFSRTISIAESIVPRRDSPRDVGKPRPYLAPAIAEVLPTVPARVARAVAARVDGEARPLLGYGRRLVETLARRHPNRLSRTQLALLSKSSTKSSSYDAALKELRDGGYVSVVGGDYELTSIGWEVMGGAPPAPQSAEELRAAWRASLPGNVAAAVFDALVGAYPEPLTKEQVAEQTGASLTSSTFDGAFTILRKAGLLEGDRAGFVAAPILFG